jgi:type II secretory pathway component PulM
MTDKISDSRLKEMADCFMQSDIGSAFQELIAYRKQATDDAEPQADDVETIRAIVEEHGIAQEFDIDDGVKLVQFALTRLSAGKVEPWSCDGCVQFGCQACARFYNDLYSPITPSGKE